MGADPRRKALIVGIDDYPEDPLAGCAEDAARMKDLLGYHEDGRANYSTNTLSSGDETVTRARLREALEDHFLGASGYDLVFYFAGHGVATKGWGGELVTSDYSSAEGGISMRDVANLANDSRAREVVVILDCCFSGAIADVPEKPVDLLVEQAQIREDVSIMAASRQSQAAFGDDSGGFFTSALARGLEGAAADAFGNVTPIGLHECARVAFAQNVSQRPVFKSYHVHPPVLREVRSRTSLETLKRLTELFPELESKIAITAAHAEAPGDEPTDEQKVFKDLSRFSHLGLIDLDGFDALSHAADRGEVITLSPLGRYYWELIDDGNLS